MKLDDRKLAAEIVSSYSVNIQYAISMENVEILLAMASKCDGAAAMAFAIGSIPHYESLLQLRDRAAAEAARLLDAYSLYSETEQD